MSCIFCCRVLWKNRKQALLSLMIPLKVLESGPFCYLGTKLVGVWLLDYYTFVIFDCFYLLLEECWVKCECWWYHLVLFWNAFEMTTWKLIFIWWELVSVPDFLQVDWNKRPGNMSDSLEGEHNSSVRILYVWEHSRNRDFHDISYLMGSCDNSCFSTSFCLCVTYV